MNFLGSLHILAPLVIVLVIWFARRRLRGIPDRGTASDAAALPREAKDEQVVPVSQLILRRLLSKTSNGISPKLSITPSGLRYKVFKPGELRFDEVRRVDARKDLFHGSRLIFTGDGVWLHVLTKREAARALLQGLPPHVPLTPAAAALRDGQ